MAQRWERAYWVANLMSPHLKHPVKPAVLMKPFIKPKSSREIAEERQEFFEKFAEQRKEAAHAPKED